MPGINSLKERVNWIDCSKGICICLVLLMHVEKPTIYSRICVPFFLSQFFFVSGYLFSGNTRKSLLKWFLKQIKQFAILASINILCIYYITGQTLTIKPFVGTILQMQTNEAFPETFLWFIPCMIVAKLIFQILYKISKNEKIFFLLELTATLVGVFITYRLSILSAGSLPWYIQTALYIQLFMLLGYFYKKYEHLFKLYEEIILCISAFLYLFLVFKFNIDADLATVYYTDFGMYILQSVLGTVAFSLFIKRLCQNRNFSFFEYIGRNSLFYYAFENVARLVISLYVLKFFELASIYALSIVNVFCCVVLLTLIVCIKNNVYSIYRISKSPNKT